MHRRVTVVGPVCLLSHISPLEHRFVLKILPRTQRATEVKEFFSEMAPLQRYTASAIVWLSVQPAILETAQAFQ